MKHPGTPWEPWLLPHRSFRGAPCLGTRVPGAEGEIPHVAPAWVVGHSWGWGWGGNAAQHSFTPCEHPGSAQAQTHHHVCCGKDSTPKRTLQTLAWSLTFLHAQNGQGQSADPHRQKFCWVTKQKLNSPCDCDTARNSLWDKQKHRPKLFTAYLVTFHYGLSQHADASWHSRCNLTCHTLSSDFQEFLRHVSFKKQHLSQTVGPRVHLKLRLEKLGWDAKSIAHRIFGLTFCLCFMCYKP